MKMLVHHLIFPQVQIVLSRVIKNELEALYNDLTNRITESKDISGGETLMKCFEKKTTTE